MAISPAYGLEHFRHWNNFTQMDDEGKEFVVAYASQSNNNTEAQYSAYEENAWLQFGQLYTFGVIFMAVNFFCT